MLADAGYGTSAAFRHALSARGLTWAVGILRLQTVYPVDVAIEPRPRAPTGRPPKHPVTTAVRLTAEQALAARPPAAWRRISWRRGTKGPLPLSARFAAHRVRVADGADGADGAPNARGQHLPGDEVWLVGERRATGERKYYLTNHPRGTPLRVLAAAIKARWVCEQAHQQLKQELGLDHFEGRSWSGLHHHALLTRIAFAFLQHRRLQHRRLQHCKGAVAGPGTPAGPPPQPTLPAVRRLLFRLISTARRCPQCDGPLQPARPAGRKVAK